MVELPRDKMSLLVKHPLDQCSSPFFHFHPEKQEGISKVKCKTHEFSVRIQ